MTLLQAFWVVLAADFGVALFIAERQLRQAAERSWLGEFVLSVLSTSALTLSLWLAARWWPQ